MQASAAASSPPESDLCPSGAVLRSCWCGDSQVQVSKANRSLSSWSEWPREGVGMLLMRRSWTQKKHKRLSFLLLGFSLTLQTWGHALWTSLGLSWYLRAVGAAETLTLRSRGWEKAGFLRGPAAWLQAPSSVGQTLVAAVETPFHVKKKSTRFLHLFLMVYYCLFFLRWYVFTPFTSFVFCGCGIFSVWNKRISLSHSSVCALSLNIFSPGWALCMLKYLQAYPSSVSLKIPVFETLSPRLLPMLPFGLFFCLWKRVRTNRRSAVSSLRDFIPIKCFLAIL